MERSGKTKKEKISKLARSKQQLAGTTEDLDSIIQESIKRKKSKHPTMTIDWLREFNGFQNFTDEQAEEALNTIRTLASIAINSGKKDDHDLELESEW